MIKNAPHPKRALRADYKGFSQIAAGFMLSFTSSMFALCAHGAEACIEARPDVISKADLKIVLNDAEQVGIFEVTAVNKIPLTRDFPTEYNLETLVKPHKIFKQNEGVIQFSKRVERLEKWTHLSASGDLMFASFPKKGKPALNLKRFCSPVIPLTKSQAQDIENHIKMLDGK